MSDVSKLNWEDLTERRRELNERSLQLNRRYDAAPDGSLKKSQVIYEMGALEDDRMVLERDEKALADSEGL
jgi:hypothetical protein